jgi:hypothetical protein
MPANFHNLIVQLDVWAGYVWYSNNKAPSYQGQNYPIKKDLQCERQVDTCTLSFLGMMRLIAYLVITAKRIWEQVHKRISSLVKLRMFMPKRLDIIFIIRAMLYPEPIVW